MKVLATFASVVLLLACDLAPAVAQPADRDGDVVAQRHRPRTRVLVRPLYPYRHYHALYPPPYDIEYPGPNAHRECSGGFATEHRASGTVIVPRLHCRWAGGRYAGP